MIATPTTAKITPTIVKIFMPRLATAPPPISSSNPIISQVKAFFMFSILRDVYDFVSSSFGWCLNLDFFVLLFTEDSLSEW